MLIIPPPVFRRRRGRFKNSSAAPVGVPLVLGAATYEPEDPSVLLGFDRAIGIGGLVASAIVVEDRDNGLLLRGIGGELLTSEVVQINLEVVGSASGSGVVLNAAAENGILAVDDSGTWAGASGLVLPFG